MARLVETFAVLVAATLLLCSPAAAEGAFVVGNGPGHPIALMNGNHPTSAEAQAAGLSQCRNEGWSNCRVAATYRNTCYAYAFARVPGGGLGGAAGATEQEARRNAIATCQRYNPGSSCYAHDSACDTVDEQEVRSAQEAQARAQAEEAARERAERDERRRQRQAELQREREEQQRREDNEERQRIADADSKRRTSETEFCLAGDIYACNRLLNNPRLTTTERASIEAKRRELFFKDQTDKTEKPPRVPEPTPAEKAPTASPTKEASRIERITEAALPHKIEQPALPARPATPAPSTTVTNFLWALSAIAAIAFSVLAILGITALPYHPKTPRYPDRFKDQFRTAFAIDAIADAYKAICDLPSVIRYKLFPRDTPQALNAMQLAHAYVSELEEEELVGASEELRTLSLAARQIRKAEWFDPDALLTVTAEKDVTQTLTLAKLKARALLAEATIRVIRDQPNRAATCLKHAIRLSPNDAHLHFSLGVVLTDLAQKRQAISTLKTAVQLQPTDIEYRKALDRARHISRSAKAVRDAGITLRGFVALVRYSLFGLIAWLLYAYVLAPGWMAGQARNPNPGLWEWLTALLVYSTIAFLIIVVPILLLRNFIGWVIGGTAADIYTGITNPFRRR